MTKYTAVIEGMSCEMCEAHINDVIRSTFNVKKVKSNRKKNESVFIADDDIDENRLEEAIRGIGYTFVSLAREPYVKKGLFW